MEILGALFGGHLSCTVLADSNNSVTAAQVNGWIFKETSPERQSFLAVVPQGSNDQCSAAQQL